MALEQFSGWTFISPCPIPDDISPLLIQNEEPIQAFKTVRDCAVFTNRRLIIRDAQGLTGSKIEMYSVPFTKVTMWSTETAGRVLDWDAELQLWTNVGQFKIHLAKEIDIRAIDRLVASCVMGA